MQVPWRHATVLIMSSEHPTRPCSRTQETLVTNGGKPLGEALLFGPWECTVYAALIFFLGAFAFFFLSAIRSLIQEKVLEGGERTELQSGVLPDEHTQSRVVIP